MHEKKPSAATRRRVAYSIAAGASVAVGTTDASAQIVWSTPQNIAIEQGASQTLNLDGDFYYDLQLKNYVFTGGNYQGAYVIYAPGKTVAFRPGGIAYASALSVGDLIAPSTTETGFPTTSLAYGAINPDAEFNDAPDSYLGISFPIAGVLHYGWVRVSIDNPGGTFVIRDWAYSITPNQPIAAGQRADFNGDGVTDAADYTVWRDTFGTTRVDDEFIAADVDLSNEVDQADYDIWAADYGLAAPAETPPASRTVPEPMTLGMLAAGAAGVSLLRRRRNNA